MKKGFSILDTFIYDEADASEESPTALPSNKFQYIMNINNSKLARKPYYKRLLNNQFETQFCEILEPVLKVSAFSALGRKHQLLYLVFCQANASDSSEQTKNDCIDFFHILL